MKIGVGARFGPIDRPGIEFWPENTRTARFDKNEARKILDRFDLQKMTRTSARFEKSNPTYKYIGYPSNF